MTRKESVTKSARAWENMKKRCYSKDYHKLYPTYIGCSICNDWLDYEVFKKWFESNYKEGFVLDKDILIKGNKIYSPETCCFVPQIINSLYKQHPKSESVGIFFNKISFVVLLNKFGKRCNFGSFKLKEHAILAYENAKKDYRKELAEIYKDKINTNVYNILKND